MAKWQTPDELGDDCCLKIPWKSGIFSHLLGALREMTYEGNWEQFGAVTKTEVVQYIIQAMLMIENSCADSITDIRVSPDGKLQVKKGGIWQDADGDGGDTTVVNNNQTLIEEYYDNFDRPEGVSDSDMACSVAEGLSAWLADQFNAALDEIEVASNEFVALTSITAIFPPLYMILQPIAQMIDNISELGLSIVRALFDANAEEGILCAIYCYLRFNGGVVTINNVGELKNEILNSLPTGLFGVWGHFLNGIENAALVARASFYQGGGDVDCGLLCISCGGCSLFDTAKVEWTCTLGFAQNGTGCFDTDAVTTGLGGGEVELWLELSEVVIFNKLVFRTSNQSTGGAPKTSIMAVYNDETFVGNIFTVTSPAPASDCELNVFENFALVGNRLRIYESSPSQTIFSDITACWDGQ